jgi:hypothetical protein
MGIDGTVIVTAMGLFLTWSVALISSVFWLSNKFTQLERQINGHVTEDQWSTEHDILRRRVMYIERWALRLNGSVKINFADATDKDLLG